MHNLRKKIWIFNSILVVIFLLYSEIKDPLGLGPLYENKFVNGIIDTVYYSQWNHNKPTIKLIIANNEITFSSYYAEYGMDLCKKLSKGDTLIKQKDNYDFYRINGNQIDTFKYIGTENFLEFIGWNKKTNN